MGFIFILRSSQYIINFDRASDSHGMAVRICQGNPFQLLIAMIHYRLLSLFGDPEEKLWPFVFAMGFIFILTASRYIMSFNRESESIVMVVQIFVGIPFELLIAMIYYGPQSDIPVNTFARRNSPESSMLNFERRDRLLALFGDAVEKLWSFVFVMASFLSKERLNKL